MAAFSSFQRLDSSSSLSVFQPYSSSSSPPIDKLYALFDDPNYVLSQLFQHNVSYHDPSLLSATNKNSMDSSISVVTHPKKLPPINKKRKFIEVSSPNSAQSKVLAISANNSKISFYGIAKNKQLDLQDMREVKGRKKKKDKLKDCEKIKQAKEAPTGYVHVRARRGQATDSHSLAERVRRERISERMKLLQTLVPGCDKVAGKAVMLDEIINYVQSLQNQVEFLSMKLASFNPILYDFGMDLESLMVRPDQDLNSLPAGIQECSPTSANAYPVLNNSLLLNQSQIPNALSQGYRQASWEVDDQRQQIINQSGINKNLFSL